MGLRFARTGAHCFRWPGGRLQSRYEASPRMKHRPDWPLWGALLLLWASMAAMVLASLRRTDGHLVYTLDDAYIHMAIAKHFARDGVWGVTPYAFGSSTSSPLWTALVAAAFR